MTTTAATTSRKLTSESTSWRVKPNTRRTRKLGRESRQTNWSNIFRWYRSGWARYTQADPKGIEPDVNVYRYAYDSPLMLSDPLGLDVRLCCRAVEKLEFTGLRHCYVESNTNGRRETWGLQNIGGWSESRKNYPKDKGGECTAWLPSSSCDDGKCFTQYSNSYPRERYSSVMANLQFGIGGGNSNTFARCAWQKCRPAYYSTDWDRVIGVGGNLAPGWFQPCR